MKKLFAVLVVMVMVMAGTAYAEYVFPGDGEKVGTIGKDGKSFRQIIGNEVVFEGATSDAYETKLVPTDPTADRVVTLPNASGTVVLEDGSGTITLSGSNAQILVHNGTSYVAKTLSGDVSITNAGVASIEAGTDGQMLIYNGTELWGPKTISGDVTITNAGVTSLEAGSDAQIMINNATEGWGPKTISGDATITNAGVWSIGANKIGTAEANLNSVSLTVASGAGYNTVAVEAGSTLINWRLTNAGNVFNTPAIGNTDATTWFINTNGNIGFNGAFSLLFLRP